MLPEYFVIIGSIIFFFGSISYFIETIQGKVKPNRITWFLWALAPFIAFYAQIKQGVGIQSLLTFTVGFIPIIIFLASFVNKKAYWKITRLDWLCGILSVGGVILWQVTKIGNIAITFAILADFLAALPTIIKSYTNPDSENYLLYFTNAVSAGLTLLTIKNWNFETVSFPLYIFVLTGLLAVLIKFKIGEILLDKKPVT